MQFLTLSECGPILALTQPTIRGRLTFNKDVAARQMRLAAGPTRDVERLGYFAEALLRWLPNDRGRLLFIHSWASNLGNPFEALMAMRSGLGETRSLSEAPGHYIGPFSWTWDQFEITPDQAKEAGLLIGILFIVMGSGWYAWLAAENCADSIEFWEGNVLFYSEDRLRITAAKTILRTYNCRRKMR
jgi:hypothetical protein